MGVPRDLINSPTCPSIAPRVLSELTEGCVTWGQPQLATPIALSDARTHVLRVLSFGGGMEEACLSNAWDPCSDYWASASAPCTESAC
jgi:hypothetical protein